MQEKIRIHEGIFAVHYVLDRRFDPGPFGSALPVCLAMALLSAANLASLHALIVLFTRDRGLLAVSDIFSYAMFAGILLFWGSFLVRKAHHQRAVRRFTNLPLHQQRQWWVWAFSYDALSIVLLIVSTIPFTDFVSPSWGLR
jgi:uncharacterized membrane protein YgdD (TMEM256/DUF423 family)